MKTFRFITVIGILACVMQHPTIICNQHEEGGVDNAKKTLKRIEFILREYQKNRISIKISDTGLRYLEELYKKLAKHLQDVEALYKSEREILKFVSVFKATHPLDAAQIQQLVFDKL